MKESGTLFLQRLFDNPILFFSVFYYACLYGEDQVEVDIRYGFPKYMTGDSSA